MILTVKPTSCLRGDVWLPASKSYSIRAFMIAACGGTSRIINPSNCDDALVAKRVAQYLGAKIVNSGRKTFVVYAGKKSPNLSRINVKESGTVLRFLLPLLPLYGQRGCVVGEGTLRGRPNHFLTQVLRKQGINIRGKGILESVPVNLRGGKFKGGKIPIYGNLSSQFISALLIAGSKLEVDTEIIIKGRRVVSSDYIPMTHQVLAKAGIKIKKVGKRCYKIRGNQKLKGLKNFTVPSDYGLAAFFLASGALVQSKLNLKGYLTDDFIQADGRIISLLQQMGVKFKKTSRSITLSGPFKLKGGAFSLKDCPDLVPIMSVLALFAKGKTRLYDIKHARAKESDRISDLRGELLKVGAEVTEKSDELIIHPKEKYRNNVLLDPHHDHRLAMSFCVLGLKLGARIKNIECVSKSYPDFVKDFRKIGASIRD